MAARRVSWIFLILLAAGHEASAQDLTTMSGTITTRPDSLRVLGAAVPVALIASSHVSTSLLNRIWAETAAIWKPAGITFEWHRATTTDGARTSWLEMTIDEGRTDVQAGQAALGWIPFTEDRPMPSIHLSLSNAEELLLRTPGVEDKTIATHETLLGRALGRALSHELGHYLLRSKLHTPHGLISGATGITDGEWLAIFVEDEEGRIVAGICGNTWGGCLEIRQFWVEESRRKQGLGTRLLRAAEREARRRGCRQILLMTFTFQAPAFYANHGFEVIATVDDHPCGHKNLLLRKPLDEFSSPAVGGTGDSCSLGVADQSSDILRDQWNSGTLSSSALR
jgi:GNAT superfamily N-acetyltransferase